MDGPLIHLKVIAQDSEFRSFFGRIEDAIISFRDLLTFSNLLLTPFEIESIQPPHFSPKSFASYLQIQVHQFNSVHRANLSYIPLNPYGLGLVCLTHYLMLALSF